MYSSRMRTARLLPISPSMHCSRGVYLPGGIPARRIPAHGVYLPRGVPAQWGVPAWGVPAWGVFLPRGVPAQGGVPAQVLPPVNRMTDRCKNITLPKTSFAGGNKCPRMITAKIQDARNWSNVGFYF